MKKQTIISFVIVTVLMFSMFAAFTPRGTSGTTINLGASSKLFDVNPANTQQLTDAELDAPIPADPTPFNVAMVGADQTAYDGSGIYVAVLDTGLLSNWASLFPPGTVNIDTADGIGFTHNVFFVGSGGNFSNDGHFSYGPLLNTRGFITHDIYTPDTNGFFYGSGHGTHVTSIVTGYHFDRAAVHTWIRGVAPKATIIPVLVLDDWVVFDPIYGGWVAYTGGTDEMVAAGIRYIGDLAAAKHIKIIINMSLGGPGYTQEEKDAVDYAISKGVIIVASAGNSGYAGMGWPGAFPEVISAAAAGWTQEYGGGYYSYYWWWNTPPSNLHTTNTVFDGTSGTTYTDKWEIYLTDFSSRPNKALGQNVQDLDVASVGAAVRGPFKNYGLNTWAYYAVWGTSQAAPHVSGTAAIVAEAHPTLGQADMEKILKDAAHHNQMPPDSGEYVSDVFSTPAPPYAAYHYVWKDARNAGSGFLTVGDALNVANRYP